jgi:phage terminase large subunit-like protein
MSDRPLFVPTYRRHKQSGQAIVTLTDGAGGRRDVLLGKHGSADSRREYLRVISEWEAGGRRLTAATAAGQTLSINELAIAFLRHAEGHYRRPDGTSTNELTQFRYCLRWLRELYGHTPAVEFGPLALKAVRARLVDDGLSRGVVNQRIGRKRAKGAYWWSALYQQNPAPREGSAFNREWLRFYSRFGTGYCLGGPGSGAEVITTAEIRDLFLTVDTAATVKEKAKPDPDYTVVSAWALARGRLLWLGCARAQLEVPDIPPFVMRQHARHRARRIFVEGGGTQKGVAQMLRRLNPTPNFVELPTSGHGDKLTRAHGFLIMAEAGNVWLPLDDPEFPRDAVEFELLSFTGDGRGGHDDIWDTAGMAGRVAEGKTSQGNVIPRVIKAW